MPSFNPRPRVGGDLLLYPSPFAGLQFQSTPPRGGRRNRNSLIYIYIGFNPRPRVGGDTTHYQRLHGTEVSIHAPAWGATQTAAISARIVSVSIHAPAWGATLAGVDAVLEQVFQSTPDRKSTRLNSSHYS
mgnify:FL=1